jgi:hypothetical protein
MKAPVKLIVLFISIVLESIAQFNLTIAEEFVAYLRAVHATGALTAQYHSSLSSDRTAAGQCCHYQWAVVNTIK